MFKLNGHRMRRIFGFVPVAEHEPRKPEIQTVGTSLFRPLKVRIFHERDTVVLDIDGHELKMEYPYAIAVSQQLRLHGKQAKKWAGDATKHWSTDASILTDAEENYRRGW